MVLYIFIVNYLAHVGKNKFWVCIRFKANFLSNWHVFFSLRPLFFFF